MQKPTLASTLHNPNQEMLALVKKTLDEQKRLFSSVNIVATKETDKNLINYLKENVDNLKLVKAVTGGSSKHRKLAVKMALKGSKESGFIFHIDYDRLIHWMTNYPKELEKLTKNHPKKHDILSVGRTKRAFLTHPEIQRKWESWTNNKIKKLSGRNIDITSGCQIFSNKMAKIIAGDSKKNLYLSPIEGDWLGLAISNGCSIGSISVEGLEFETATFHQNEIKKLGSEKIWREKTYKSKKMLEYREKIAKDTLEAAKKRLID